MICGFRCTPRRPVFAGRVAVLLCLLVVLFAGPTAPARAYVCAGSSLPNSRVAAQESCEQPAPAWRKHGDADAKSFVFFSGALCAVLLIPLAFGRRDELPPE
ncbi:MAG TPA: hypothetical protein VKC65_03955 [Gaiellaceae bacterium]|nr:hypothetical protein [Gaiellaceae bacterium]